MIFLLMLLAMVLIVSYVEAKGKGSRAVSLTMLSIGLLILAVAILFKENSDSILDSMGVEKEERLAMQYELKNYGGQGISDKSVIGEYVYSIGEDYIVMLSPIGDKILVDGGFMKLEKNKTKIIDLRENKQQEKNIKVEFRLYEKDYSFWVKLFTWIEGSEDNYEIEVSELEEEDKYVDFKYIVKQ